MEFAISSAQNVLDKTIRGTESVEAEEFLSINASNIKRGKASLFILLKKFKSQDRSSQFNRSFTFQGKNPSTFPSISCSKTRKHSNHLIFSKPNIRNIPQVFSEHFDQHSLQKQHIPHERHFPNIPHNQLFQIVPHDRFGSHDPVFLYVRINRSNRPEIERNVFFEGESSDGAGVPGPILPTRQAFGPFPFCCEKYRNSPGNTKSTRPKEIGRGDSDRHGGF
ncbi:MAG: hypothetical protein J6J31_02920 [Thermoguttaceae bacterium]|nr:hypothetical protein [Thermoguttaceae bacterium]